MSAVGSQAKQIVRIQNAATRVLEDNSFKRAPVMSRLLKYLVEMTAQGVPQKSHTIAIEALGKSENDLADADTYARVAVARLRRALVNYFAAHPGDDEIYIDSGSYEVLIKCSALLDRPVSADQIVESSPLPRLLVHFRSYALRYAIVCFALLAALGGIHFHDEWRDRARWLASDFPTLAITRGVEEAGVQSPVGDSDNFRNILSERLLDHIGFQLIEAGDERADYEVRLDVDQLANREVETVSLVETATQRLVWTKRYSFSDQSQIPYNATLAATAIAAPGGALNNFARGKRLSSRSPYGCWLRFTETVMSFSSIEDDELRSCAADWYAADEAHPVATFLRNWTMVNESMRMLRQSSRQAALEDALAVVQQGLARNPDSAMLYTAEMRTYSFLRERNQVVRAAKSAFAIAPNNRGIAGMAGTWLTFWNDPQGAEILEGLDGTPGVALPWEHAGHFVAAMMKDDVQGAGEHLGHLRLYMKGQPALNLLNAAYAGRTGKPRMAEAALDELRNHPRAWIVGPDEIMDRLPVAPEVRLRLEEWIDYKPAQSTSE